MATRTKDLLARDVFLNLLRVHDRLTGEFEKLFRSVGLTMTQFNVLRILRGAGKAGASCQYVGERLLTRVPDVTRLLDRMESAGLVRRTRSTADRRVVLVEPTPEGRRLCDQLEQPVLELHRKQFEGMTVQSLTALDEALQEVLRLR